MNYDEKCRLIINWALGLISTNGFISYSHRKHPLICIVTTTEKEWAENVQEKISSIGIETKIDIDIHDKPNHNDCYKVRVRGGRFKYLVEKYGEAEFCSPRKWELIIKSFGYKNTGLIYTDSENDFLEENYNKYTDKEIAMKLRRTPRGIKKQRLILGLSRNRYKHLKKEYKIARKLRKEGKTYQEISDILKDQGFDVAFQTVGNWCKDIKICN
jgi:hypothetical protein